MASSGYTTMTLVGGQASGESYAIADLVGSIRIPIRQPSIFLVNKADLREATNPARSLPTTNGIIQEKPRTCDVIQTALAELKAGVWLIIQKANRQWPITETNLPTFLAKFAAKPNSPGASSTVKQPNGYQNLNANGMKKHQQ